MSNCCNNDDTVTSLQDKQPQKAANTTAAFLDFVIRV